MNKNKPDKYMILHYAKRSKWIIDMASQCGDMRIIQSVSDVELHFIIKFLENLCDEEIVKRSEESEET